MKANLHNKTRHGCLLTNMNNLDWMWGENPVVEVDSSTRSLVFS